MSSLVLHFKNYFGAHIATRALSFISIPVFTRILTPHDYGIYNVFNSYMGVFFVVLTLNGTSSLGRYYYEEEIDFKLYLSTAVAMILIVIALSSSILLIFTYRFASLFKLPAILICVMPLTVVLSTMDSLFNQIFQAKQESRLIAVVSIFRGYVVFGLSVLFILFLSRDKYIGIVAANMLVSSLVGIYVLNIIRPYFVLKFSKEYAIKVFHYSLPMMPYVLSSIILDQFDRIMINNYKGAVDTGLYSFAYNIAMLLNVFTGALFQAWMPKYFELMNAKDYKLIDQYIDKMIRTIVVFSCTLMLFGQEIGITLADKKFHGALSIIPIIVLGYLFSSIFSIYAWSMGFALKTYWLSVIVLLSGVLNIILNKIYIPEYGYIAAAYTTMASYLFMALLSWLCNKFALKSHSTPIMPILYTISFSFATLCFMRTIAWLSLSPAMMIIFKILLLVAILLILTKKYLNTIRAQITTVHS